MTVFSPSAEAHLNSTGLGPVYDGLLHFLASPEDILPVIVALSFLAGLRGPAHGRRVLFVLPAAWFFGALIGLITLAPGSVWLTCVSFLLLGGLLAADAQISIRLMTVLAALVGLFHAYFDGAGMWHSTDAVLALLGLVFAVFVYGDDHKCFCCSAAKTMG